MRSLCSPGRLGRDESDQARDVWCERNERDPRLPKCKVTIRDPDDPAS